MLCIRILSIVVRGILEDTRVIGVLRGICEECTCEVLQVDIHIKPWFMVSSTNTRILSTCVIFLNYALFVICLLLQTSEMPECSEEKQC